MRRAVWIALAAGFLPGAATVGARGDRAGEVTASTVVAARIVAVAVVALARIWRPPR